MRHEAGFRVEAVTLVRLAGLAAGTRVAGPAGAVAVERLRRLDRVAVPGGVAVVTGVEARRARVAAVRIAAGALAPGVPERDLVVGPATRLWLPGPRRSVEARRLVDGVRVVAEEARAVTLYTVTLAAEGAVVRAEGVEVCV